MPSRSTPRLWRRAFLRALARTANVTAAAAEAGVDISTPYHNRKRNPLFARDWERALLAGQRALAAGKWPKRARSAAGKARPRVLCRSGDGVLKLIKPAWDRWNEDKEERFFEELKETANINLAAQSVGISAAALWRRRQLWPDFDAAVRTTREMAAESLNLQLIKAGSDTMAPPRIAHEVPTLLVSVDQAIRIVQMNLPELRDRGGSGGGRGRRGVPVTPALTADQVCARIEETLARLPDDDAPADAGGGAHD